MLTAVSGQLSLAADKNSMLRSMLASITVGKIPCHYRAGQRSAKPAGLCTVERLKIAPIFPRSIAAPPIFSYLTPGRNFEGVTVIDTLLAGGM